MSHPLTRPRRLGRHLLALGLAVPAAASLVVRGAAQAPFASGDLWDVPTVTRPAAPRLGSAVELIAAGRPADALASLMKTHAGLPPGTDPASAALLLSRIRDLEVQLEVPPLERYRPTGVRDETLTARQAGG